ncbi:MAG: TetR/AcrR family transcriptional regulator [Bacteroidota bacterium]|nr:TetR/AcrR family transcriptional regulator [Bacteroidota bacterium]
MRIKDEDKVNRIYGAAMKVINQEGFQGSSMTRIATEANLSPATIYLYFENKDDMIKKLFIHLKSRMGNSYFNSDADLSPSKGTFRTIWLNHYQYIMDNPEEYNFLENFSNCPLIGHIEKEHNQDYCPAFEALFEQAKSARLLQPLHNDIIYSLLFAPISQMVKKSKSEDRALTTNDLIQIFEASWKAVSQ